MVVEALRLRQFFLERLSDQGPEGMNTGADHSIAVLLGKPACLGQPFQTLVTGVTSWVGWGEVRWGSFYDGDVKLSTKHIKFPSVHGPLLLILLEVSFLLMP